MADATDSKNRDYPEHYPFPFREGVTHWEDCWRYPGHHNCAVDKVYSLMDAVEELDDEIKLWEEAHCGCYQMAGEERHVCAVHQRLERRSE